MPVLSSANINQSISFILHSSASLRYVYSASDILGLWPARIYVKREENLCGILL